MNEQTANVPEQIRQEAKAKALKVIETNKGCISYVRPEDLETASLFVPIVTAVIPVKQEFHEFIPNIGIMPQVPLMNRIREAAGVNINRTDTTQESEDVWVGHSFGDKRMPDGTMQPDDAVYEFNAKTRAERDFLNKPDKYKTEIEKQKHLLELRLFGRSKAETGAQLRLIAKLAKIERSFKTEADLLRGMIVLRVDRNVNGILQDPNMREAVIQHALGATEAVFGPKQIEAEGKPAPRTVDEQSGEVLEQPKADPEQPELDTFEDDIPWQETPENITIRGLKNFLELKDPKLIASGGWKQAVELINGTLNKDGATLEEMKKLIERTERWLKKYGFALPTEAKKEGSA